MNFFSVCANVWQITRGSIFIFGIQMTAFGCKLPDSTGRDCTSSVTQLCAKLGTSSHSNSREINGNFKPPSGENDLEIEKQARSTRLSGVDEEPWSSLKLQRVSPGAWKYFSLEVADYFPARLEIRAECANSSCGVRAPESGREVGKFYLNFGSLPSEGDEFGVITGSSLPISVPSPRRGQWFIGVRGNLNLTTVLEFSLFWRVLSCPYGMVGENCTSTVNSLEVRLSKVAAWQGEKLINPTSPNFRRQNHHVQTNNRLLTEQHDITSWCHNNRMVFLFSSNACHDDHAVTKWIVT